MPADGETFRTPLRPPRSRTLAFAVALCALFQFVLQAWIAWRFAAEVWTLPGELSFAVPGALDAFVVVVMIATFVLRTAPPSVRAYAWMVMAVGVGVQVGAAEGYAAHQGWGVWGRAASSCPALFLAASLHLWIVVQRHLDGTVPAPVVAPPPAPGKVSLRTRLSAWAALRRLVSAGPDPAQIEADRALALAARDVERQTKQAKALVITHPEFPSLPPAPAVAPAPAPPVELAPPRATRKVKAEKVRRSADPNPVRQDAVKRVLEGGETAAAVAHDLGLSIRTVQLWVQRARKGTSAVTK